MSDAFVRARNSLTRAAYQGLLHRAPDRAALDSLSGPRFSDEQEREMSELLRKFVQSQEFRGLLAGVKEPNYAPSTWARVELKHFLMWVDLGDLGVSYGCVYEGFEPQETAFIRNIIKPGMTFLDIGANVGWFSLNAAERVGPKGRVIAFEPREDTFRALTRSFADNGFSERATLINAAAGAEPGEIMIGWHENSANPGGTWTLAHEDLEATFKVNGAKLQSAPVKVIDEVIGDTPIHVMKIDIEGAEPIALRGASKLLLNQRPTILCEINPLLLDRVSQMTPFDFVRWVEAQGYTCHVLEDGRVGERLDASAMTATSPMLNVVFKPL